MEQRIERDIPRGNATRNEPERRDLRNFEVMAEMTRRRRIVCPVSGAAALMLFTTYLAIKLLTPESTNGRDAASTSITADALLLVLGLVTFALLVVAAGVNIVLSRCASCKRWSKRLMRATYCPACGIQLKSGA